MTDEQNAATTAQAQGPETVTLTLPRRHHLPGSKTPLTKAGIAEDMITQLSTAVSALGSLCCEYFMTTEPPEYWALRYGEIANRATVLYHHLDMIQNILSAAYDMPDQYFRDQLETLITPGE